ncbi:MAG: OmpA family protein [Ignavibacteriaceae bacterium]
MKTLITCLTAFFVLSVSFCSFAQFDILNKVEKKIEKKAEDETDTVIEKGINKTVDAAKSSGQNEDKGKNVAVKKSGNTDNLPVENKTSDEAQPPEELKLYAKYDFVPGDKIIFEDNLTGEESGEFPSRWDLLSGSAENATLGNDKVIHFINNNSIILPLMGKKDFLPDVFTIEFDAYFEKQAVNRWDHYQIRLFEGTGGSFSVEGKTIYPIQIAWNEAKMGEFGGRIAAFTKEQGNWQGKWKHIAISFNKRSLKLYLDEERILNIPNLGYKPSTFSIGSDIDDQSIKMSAIKNIKVNEGGIKLYDRILADGKFVTRGILFEVNKADITPQSMGTINDIVKMMKEHQDLKFSIEGHTDSDGDKAFNQKLSEERALAVKNLLVESGIESSRLETKGWGDSKPVDSNSTPEGKANNRRVEFIKI